MCIGHLYRGKNRLGQVNPSRKAKSQKPSYRDIQSGAVDRKPSRHIPAVKAEPGDPDPDVYLYSPSDTVNTAHLPAGTIFEGAINLTEADLREARDILTKGTFNPSCRAVSGFASLANQVLTLVA